MFVVVVLPSVLGLGWREEEEEEEEKQPPPHPAASC